MSGYNMANFHDEEWKSVNKLIRKHKKELIKLKFNKKKFIKKLYKEQMNRELDYDNPKSFTEKINCFKLDYKKSKYNYADLTDKNKVREYVKKKIGEEYLIPQLLCVKKLKKSHFDLLPNQFVLKANQGSGSNYIVKDKSKEDYDKICTYMNNFLKIKYQYIWGEYHYKDIKPMIVVDKLLMDKDGNLPDDIKCYCFNNGKEKHKIIFQERIIGEERYRIMFDEKWNQVFINSSYKKLDVKLEKPKNYKKLLEIFDKLSEDFGFVRVDLFLFKDKIYFGELTFTPMAGYLKFDDYNTELLWGSWMGKDY